MTPLLTKITIASASVTGVTVVGAGTAYLTFPSKPATQKTDKENNTVTSKSISDWLDGEDLVLIGEEETDPWTLAWDKFKQEYTTNNLSTNWDTLNDKKSDRDVPLEFKQLCKNKGKEKISDKNLKIYTEVKSYCTKKKVGG